MSQFYGSLQGSRGEATRQGSKKSGITGHIRAWHIGARVTCFEGDDGKDKVTINITGGSANPSCLRSLGTYMIVDGVLIESHS